MEVGHDGNGTRKWKEGKGSFAVRHQIEKLPPDRQSLRSPLPLSLHRWTCYFRPSYKEFPNFSWSSFELLLFKAWKTPTEKFEQHMIISLSLLLAHVLVRSITGTKLHLSAANNAIVMDDDMTCMNAMLSAASIFPQGLSRQPFLLYLSLPNPSP